MSHATDSEPLSTLGNPYQAPKSLPGAFARRYLTLNLCACLTVISVLAGIWIYARALKPVNTAKESKLTVATTTTSSDQMTASEPQEVQQEDYYRKLGQKWSNANWNVDMRRWKGESPFGDWGAMGTSSDSGQADDRPVE